MRVLLSWLRDFAPVGDDADAVATALDDLGMVVEGRERVGEGLGDVVVARVLETRPHPDADRVQLVEVDAGGPDALQVVCGAFNFGPGDLVPLAPVGAVLPGGFEIGRRKVRGQWSNGMLCSAAELRLSEDSAGIHVLAGDIDPGTPLLAALGIEPDVVFDLDITSNRPDAMSVAGVARDLAARLKVPFSLDAPSVPEAAYRVENLASVEVRSPDLCPRFTARVVTGVHVGHSLPWVQRRLTLAGMRPVNGVVDASNYVMLELGQPTHPYDLERLAGDGLVVRKAEPGETVVTLDGVERRLGTGPRGEGEGDCLICDAEGTPVGIAGIMGGASSEITPTTDTVLLEAAHFTAMAIARTSKRINLRTEASARFERGVDPEGIERAVARFCSLLTGGEVAAGTLDVRARPPEPTRIRVRTSRVNGLLGTDLDDETVRGYLAPIGFVAEPVAEGVHEVTVPSWRPDATIEVDVVEEVARHHGYARIPRAVPSSARTGSLTAYQRMRRHVRDVLVGLGVDEATNPPLVGPDDHARAGLDFDVVHAANPMLREESVLRASLLPGLLRAVGFNVRHRNPDVRFFEVGRVFRVPDEPGPLPDEREHLAVVLAGEGAQAAVTAWRTLAEAERLEPVPLTAAGHPGIHPGRSARLGDEAEPLGWVGEVDPGVLAAWDLDGPLGWLEVDLRRLDRAPRRPATAQPVSRYPSSDLDLAFVVPEEVAAGAVEGALAGSGPLVEWVRLFDVYRGEGVGAGGAARGLAFRLRLSAPDRTLTDTEVAEARGAAVRAAEALGATLRA